MNARSIRRHPPIAPRVVAPSKLIEAMHKRFRAQEAFCLYMAIGDPLGKTFPPSV